MNSQLPYWAVICSMAVLLSSCITFSPQESQLTQPELQKELIVQKPEKPELDCTVSCQNTLISNAVSAVSADESRVWVGTDSGLSMLDRSTGIWRHFTKEDGLGSDNVSAVTVDGHWVWVGTDDGVSRYDTEKGTWKNFQSKDGLKGKIVFCITVDGDYVWFGTDGGLNRYDKDIDSWAARTKKDGLSDNFVTAIAITGDYIWVGNRWNGVNRYDKTTDSWNTYTKKSGLIDSEITTIAAVDNFIWFGTDKSGISLYDKTNQSFVKNYTKTDVLTSNDVRAITADGNHIWIGTANGGVQRYIQAVDTWVKYTKNDGLAGDNTTCISIYNNEVWFGSYDSGVTLYNKLSNKWVQYVKADTIPSNDINDVARDAEGNLWIATVGGLAKYSPETQKWTRYGKESGLTTDFTTTVAVNGNQVWLGTARGLATFDITSGQWKYYTNTNGLSHDFITSLEITDHKAWIGTNKGLFCMSTENEDFHRIDELADKVITTVAHNSKHIWIGTQEGLWKYGFNNKEVQLYAESDGLVDNRVNTVLIWGEDNIWVGTQGGVYAYDHSTDKFQKIEDNGIADAKSISTNNVLAMSYDDSRQRIWIGKPDGLNSFDIQNKTWIHLNGFSEGKFSQHNIRAISVDKDNIWLGTASGLSEYHPSDNNWREHKASMTREFLRESSVSNIEFDGDYVWFSNWDRSQNGAIVRYDRRTDAWQTFGREIILKDTEAKSMTTIRKIVIDKDAVWFTTDYGLLRYNKADSTWEHITTEDGLLDNSVGDISCGDNVVWVSYWDSSKLTGTEISKYDKKTHKWEKIEIQYLIYPREFVDAMMADGDELWIGVGSSGLRKITKDGEQKLYTKTDGLAQNSVDWITVDGDDVWFAHRTGWDSKAITRYNKAKGSWTSYSQSDVLSSNNVDRITATERYVWIIYRYNNDSGVTVYDKKMDEWRTIKPRGGHGWRSSIEDVAEDGDYLWIGTDGDGVKRFHLASGTWTTFDYSTGLLMNDVNNHGLKVDERYVWVGTVMGLSRYDKVAESWTNFTKREALSDDEVISVVVDDRYIWCGTSEGISRYDKTYGLWKNYRHGSQGGFSIFREDMDQEERMWARNIYLRGPIDNFITALAVDSRYLWVGTKEGANRYDKVTDKWDRFEKENGLPSIDISSVMVDGYDVWMGTNAGLCKFPRMSDNLNAWVSFTAGIDIRPTAMTKEYAETLVSNEVWSVDADQEYVWIGTMRGVSRYDKKKDIWTNFTVEDGLPTNEIGSVKVDGKLVWFGSDEGVVVYDKETHDWMTFSAKDGLSSERITCIAKDDKYIWFGTSDAGIMKYDKENKAWKSFSKNDGLAHNSVFSIAVDGDKLWIGTHKGLSRYDKVKNVWTTYTRYNDSEDI